MSDDTARVLAAALEQLAAKSPRERREWMSSPHVDAAGGQLYAWATDGATLLIAKSRKQSWPAAGDAFPLELYWPHLFDVDRKVSAELPSALVAETAAYSWSSGPNTELVIVPPDPDDDYLVVTGSHLAVMSTLKDASNLVVLSYGSAKVPLRISSPDDAWSLFVMPNISQTFDDSAPALYW